MSTPTLNTFVREEAESLTLQGSYKVKSVTKIKVETIATIIESYCKSEFPDFLSVDVEGLDLRIIQSINFNQHRPTVICAETLSFSESGNGKKNKDLIGYLRKAGYILYADTNINTIFVSEDKWIR